MTGITGSLGNMFARQILENSDSEIVALVRQDAKRLVDSELRELYAVYGHRLSFIHGDLEKSSRKELSKLTFSDQLWHFAGDTSLKSENPMAVPINHEGTSRLLDAIKQVDNPPVFFYLSTAFVAGDRKGIIREDELDVGQSFRNDYELSKMMAEASVRQNLKSGLAGMIFRPSIVMGHQLTGHITKVNGLYKPVVAAALLARRGGREMRARIKPQTELDLIHIDWLTEIMISLSTNPDALGKIFHLTSYEPTKLGDLIQEVENQLGTFKIIANPSIPYGKLTFAEKLIHDSLGEFVPYMTASKRIFDRTNTNAFLPPFLMENRFNIPATIAYGIRVAQSKRTKEPNPMNSTPLEGRITSLQIQ
jgi:nucleoside-diphosphate-sugar epimerase